MVVLKIFEKPDLAAAKARVIALFEYFLGEWEVGLLAPPPPLPILFLFA
jgi:hypothetical protein